MKTQVNALLFFLLLIILSSSCRTYISPALPGNNLGYLPRQMEADSVKTLTHASASFAGASSPGNGSVSFEMGMLNINRAIRLKDLILPTVFLVIWAMPNTFIPTTGMIPMVITLPVLKNICMALV
ncbi:hypothetical protein [Pedobacter terrae]|uniref:hypothetical protein n=1 Tax=Pedobacter terrae TaxID=405671 RepID=UPI002FFA5B9F